MSLTGKPTETEDSVIANDGFFPDMVLSDFLGPYRLPAEYENESVINAVTLAIVKVNLRLSAVKATKIAEGFTTLDDCLNAQDDDRVNGKYLLAIVYETAVFSWAKSWLIQNFNTMNRRNTAAENDSAAADSTGYWLDQSASSVLTFLAAFGLQDSAGRIRDADQAYVALL